MMNLFIMIIVENFDNLNSKKDNGELEFDTMFKAVWELFDPDGTGKINMLDLEDFLKRLPNHYGLRRDASNSKFLKILQELQLHVWLEPHPELEGKMMKMIDFMSYLLRYIDASVMLTSVSLC